MGSFCKGMENTCNFDKIKNEQDWRVEDLDCKEVLKRCRNVHAWFIAKNKKTKPELAPGKNTMLFLLLILHPHKMLCFYLFLETEKDEVDYFSVNFNPQILKNMV